MSEKQPQIQIDKLFNAVVALNASDLHLRVGEKPKFRIHGVIQEAETIAIDEPGMASIAKALFAGNEGRENTLKKNGHVDFALQTEKARFRVNVFTEANGTAAVLRRLPTKMPSLQDVGLDSPFIKKLCSLDRGIILVTGATGSGKSTTLAAMVDYINGSRHGHILTLEDPIEFVHKPKHASTIISQREIGVHMNDFSTGIVAAMREDPNVILIGEMRDHESISNALTAAETGHLVLATLHASDAKGTISRIVDVFPEKQQEQIQTMLASSIAGIISQKLYPSLDGKGRVAAREILIGTPAVRALIREKKLQQIPSALQTGGNSGMITMEASIERLVKQRLIKNPADEVDLSKMPLLPEPR